MSFSDFVTASLTLALIFFIGMIYSYYIRREKTVDNPWGESADTLEWTLSSPPPFHCFETLPVIKDTKHH